MIVAEIVGTVVNDRKGVGGIGRAVRIMALCQWQSGHFLPGTGLSKRGGEVMHELV